MSVMSSPVNLFIQWHFILAGELIKRTLGVFVQSKFTGWNMIRNVNNEKFCSFFGADERVVTLDRDVGGGNF